MSKAINVNPDHYKTAGRERPGDARPKQKTPRGNEEEARERWQKRQKKDEGRSKDVRSKT
jgi:hypothetical protein